MGRREDLETRMEQLGLDDEKREQLRLDLRNQELNNMRIARKRLTTNDFDSLIIIGKGAFGEVTNPTSSPKSVVTTNNYKSKLFKTMAQVRLVRKKDSGEIFAMKSMVKRAMVVKNQVK